jgi:hypothetical protein
VLAFFAAVVPIIGSLFVGFSYLAEQARLASERRIRLRVAELADERYEAAVSRRRANPYPRVTHPSARDERMRLQSLLLAANGLPERVTSWREWEIDTHMSSGLMPFTDQRRQWVLLLSSAAGLVMLAVDAIPDSDASAAVMAGLTSALL